MHRVLITHPVRRALKATIGALTVALMLTIAPPGQAQASPTEITTPDAAQATPRRATRARPSPATPPLDLGWATLLSVPRPTDKVQLAGTDAYV
jgi:hypothetical protein